MLVGDRYELLDVVGSGGMATVWRVRDTRLDRIAALKRPHPAPAGAPELARFRRESRLAATVSHPHLVAVFDAGEDDTGPYLVMEYVDGPALDATQVPPDRAAPLGMQVASGLAALHDVGIVHGDVKPANILLGPGGAKLTDFGIARSPDATSALTQPGVVLATPAYASPETLAGGDRSPAADVYSLGTVLYELVTGARWNPSISATRPAPSDPVWASVLGSALSLERSGRPTAAELADALSSMTDGPRGAVPGAAYLPTVAAAIPPGAPTVRSEVDPPGAVAATSVDDEHQEAEEPGATAAARGPEEPARSGGTGRRALAIFVAVLVLVGAVGLIVALVERADAPAGSAASNTPTTSTTTPDQATTTSATAATTVAPTTTVPVTAVPTTVAPVAAAPTEPGAARPVEAVHDELIALVEGLDGSELRANHSRLILSRVKDAIKQAEGGKVDKSADRLAEAADRVVEHVQPTAAREEALALIAELADSLDVGVDVTADQPGD